MRLPDGLLMDDDGRRGGRSDNTLRTGGWRRCVDQAIGTLGLARAFIPDAPILILDKPLAARPPAVALSLR
jgi:ABC-type thiamine transport system ATPase subunit